MSLASILRGPTRNTAWYLFPWNLLVFYLILLVGLGFSLGLLMAQHWLMSGLALNLFLVSVVGMMAREQLTYAFVACLPRYQQALRRHLVLVGVVANVLLLLLGLVFYRVSLHDKLDTALAILCVGLALYFVLNRVILGITNLGYWNLLFTGLVLAPSLLGVDYTPQTPLVISLNPAMRLALPLLAGLSLWWFWQLLARPNHFRRVMDLPVAGGFDSSNSMEGLFVQYQLVQQSTERRRQHSRLARWVAAVRIPGYSSVSDHLNVVVNRALSLLASPTFWITTAVLCLLQALSWRSGPRFAAIFMVYPVLLLIFTLRGTEAGSASPLLPHSRRERAVGMLAANLLSLTLFFAFLWITWRGSVLLGPLVHQEGVATGRVQPRDMILAILLWVPAYYMVQLLLSLTRTGVMIVMTFAGMGCVMATVITTGAIASSHQPGAGIYLLWWFAIGWGLYLLLLYLRFSQGSLEHR